MTLSHTTLGFEIEYTRSADVDAVLQSVRQAGIDHGIPSLRDVQDDRGRYPGFSRTRWAQKYDCSCGWEIKSSPIRDTEEVKHVMKAIRDAGGTVNDDCGLHIHVGIQRLNHSGLQRLAKIYARHELSLNELLPIQRRHSASYARSNRSTYDRSVFDPSTGDLTRLFAAIDASYDTGSLRRVANSNGKYSKLNLGPIGRLRTVEFRAHQGTLNFQKIDMWASLIVAIVRLAEDASATITPQEATFEETLAELTVRATRTPRQPREGTIARRVWDRLDAFYTDAINGGGLRTCSCNMCRLFKESSATPSGHALKFQDARAMMMTELGLTQAQVHGPTQKWSKARGLTRTPSHSVEGLADFARERRATLFARACRRNESQARRDQSRTGSICN